MSSAQLDILAFDQQVATGTDDAMPQPHAFDLKQQAAERIRLHRERRARGSVAGSSPAEATPRRSQHNSIAAAVAERYAQTPSYRAFLAEQAQRAVDQAQLARQQAAQEAENAAAEAEVAARNAQAVAQVQQQLLAELELWDAPQQFTPETAHVALKSDMSLAEEPVTSPYAQESANETAQRLTRSAKAAQPVTPSSEKKRRPALEPEVPVKQISSAGLTVRLYEDIGARPRPTGRSLTPDAPDADESRALDEEILFRQSPVFEPYDISPPTAIPANLLEFPRQLVAARKARPRLAEGPLAEEEPRSPQLRIFEVEPEQISISPSMPSVTPEWANIHLDAQPEIKPEPLSLEAASRAADHSAAHTPLLASMLPPQTAPLELRFMAVAVDTLVVGLALSAFLGVTAHLAHRIPTGIPIAITAGIIYAVLFPLYELLFFTLSDQTPGMRYARIGLCTLSDENPSRSEIRRRILAQMIALCPFGLGILWALLDEDGLGWHDRISRMYQRAY